MNRQAVRLTLLTVALAAIAAAAWMTRTLGSELTANDNAARAFAAGGAAASADIINLRAAQQSYVAAGQGDAFWASRVTAIESDLSARLSALRNAATASASLPALDEAAADLQNFTQVDRRARDDVHAGQASTASDLIYSDGFDQTEKARGAVEQAVAAELAADDAAGAEVRQRIATGGAAAAAITLLVAVALTPLPGRRRHKLEQAAAEPRVPAASPTQTPGLQDLPIERPAAEPPPPAAPAENLPSLAALCTDLARVSDTGAVRTLLGRAAAALNATGLVVWIADPDGHELFPMLVHGYPPQIATRLGTIGRDADNLTGAAFRTGLLQTVKATSASIGAVAAPLTGAKGVVGVLAVELKDNGEQRDDRRAAVAIVAAQIATLVGPPSARPKAEAAG
ncbi:MAG: hypothetical protein ACRD1V_06035 [Vicinamibacterales bacterium]